ncbi:MAG: SGNH/GDSL hydrolase family protein [Pseudomonadales bacterium]
MALLAPSIAFLLLLEASARLHAWYADSKLQQGLANVGAGPTSDDFSLQHIIRWHDNPKIIFELIPGLSGEFRGHRLTINDRGFRSAPVPSSAKSQRHLRIVGVGDSVMFGWGVADGKNYVDQLGNRLVEALPGTTVDWINSAVPGYNTVNEIETLKEKLLVYDPDLVIVGYVNNDLFVPGFIRESRPYFSLRQSFLARWVRHTIDGLHLPDNELRRPPDDFRHRSFAGEEQLIPEAYREVIGIDAFSTAIAELGALAHSQGFAYLLVGHYGFSGQVEAVLESLNAPRLDAYPMVQRWLKDHGAVEYSGSPLTVSQKDSHPSALMHELLAELLADRVLHSLEDCDELSPATCLLQNAPQLSDERTQSLTLRP